MNDLSQHRMRVEEAMDEAVGAAASGDYSAAKGYMAKAEVNLRNLASGIDAAEAEARKDLDG